MKSKAHLLIIDDDANTLASLARAFRLAGHEATVCQSAEKALELVKAESYDLIFSDVVMPGKDGLQFLEEYRALGLRASVVMMSGQAHIAMAVKATKLGALDFLEKPISSDKLLLTVENALRLRRLEEENQQLRHKLGRHEMVWRSEKMQRLMAQVERVAASDTRVCIFGETGTGKELVARTLHEKSLRRSGARWRRQTAEGRRAGDRGHPSQSGRSGEAGQIPRRSVPPDRGLPPSVAAFARAPRRYRAACRALRQAHQRG